jgi:hypothetical protein
MARSNNQYFVGFDRTLGLGPIPRTTISPAIAEMTIAIRRTLRTSFHLLGRLFSLAVPRK